MKKILETIKRKWAEYLLETFVIIIGILGAFMLDEWRENRNNQQLLGEYYLLLKSELVTDTLNLVNDIEYISKSNIGFDILIKNINQELSLPPDSVLTLYSPMFGIGDFRANTETFESIKSSGNISIIKNLAINQGYFKLLRVHEVTYNFYDQRVMPVAGDVMFQGRKYFAYDKWEFHDPSFVYSQDGANALALVKLVRQSYVDHLSICLRLSKELIASIDKEIETN
jgi:hypothetical protein